MANLKKNDGSHETKPIVEQIQDQSLLRDSGAASLDGMTKAEVIKKANVVSANTSRNLKVLDDTGNFKMFAEIVKTLNADQVAATVKDWQDQLKGKMADGTRGRMPVLTSVKGDTTYRYKLTAYLESLMHDDIVLPFGDLGKLNGAVVDDLDTYLSLIAMRYRDMPSVNYDAVLLAQFGDHEELGTDISQLSSQLGDMSKEALRKYMVTQVILPLMRNNLRSRQGITQLIGVPVLDTATKYALLKSKVELSPLKSQIRSAMLTIIDKNSSWIQSYTSLKDALLTGIPQASHVGLPLLVKAIHDSDDDVLGAGYDFEVSKGDRESIHSVTPFGVFSRQAALNSLDGVPLVLHDTFGANMPKVVTKSDISWLIMKLAALKGIHIIDSMSVEFMSRYPQWSGIIVNAKNIDNQLSSDFSLFVNSILDAQFIKMATRIPSVDMSVSSLFDEPNSSDLKGHIEDAMYFVALTQRVAVDTLTDLLNVFANSYEFEDQAFWTNIKEILVISKVSHDLKGKVHYVRRYNQKSPLFHMADKTISSSYFFLESGIVYKHPATDSTMSWLNKNDLVGSMDTEMFTTRSFNVTSTGSFPIAELGQLSKFLPALSVNIDTILMDAIDRDHPLFKYKDKLHLHKKNAKAEVSAFTIVGSVAPTIITVYDLDKQDYLPMTVREFSETEMDLSALFTMIPRDNSSIILEPHSIVEVVPAGEISYVPEVLVSMPRDTGEFMSMVTKWEHDLLGLSSAE